jgi:NTP pyrophosphatase (non-canonical NTP hydrolase)
MTLNDYARECHENNAKWWYTAPRRLISWLPWPIVQGKKLDRNKGELLMLIVSEVSEAMEGERKGLMDDKLSHRSMVEVELADALIRIFDYAGAFGLDLEGAYQEKRAYNAIRVDHTYEARAAAGGKKW